MEPTSLAGDGRGLAWCSSGPPAHADDWTPSNLLLDLIRQIESADGLLLVGDDGRSPGAYQISRAAWADVNAWRKAHRLPVLEYSSNVWSESISRSYAAQYLQLLHARLARSLERSPSTAELYAAYNLGLSGFARCRYHLGRVNANTAAKCRQIKAVVRGERAFPGG